MQAKIKPLQEVKANQSGEWEKISVKDESDNTSNSSDEQFPKEGPVGVYQYMTPANPLELQKAIQPLEQIVYRALTKHRRLPDFNRETHVLSQIAKNPQECSNTEAKCTKEKKEASQSEADLETKAGKSLFTIYPEGDTRLVYRKFKSNTTVGENRLFSGYLVDLQKLSKMKESALMQYDSQLEFSHANEAYVKEGGSHLVFNSSFESGNLFAAFRVSANEYDLVLQNDINTKGNTQWFFFSVSNTKQSSTIKFNIVNLMKPDSLFNMGMKPVVYSQKENHLTGESWKREGSHISYHKNHIVKECQTGGGVYYTLTFSYHFKHGQDLVYFAHCYPYTFSDLNNYLNKIMSNPLTSQYVTRKPLCKTLAKNTCEFLTITSSKNVQDLSSRLGVVITARQHPGESLSSYMMQGAIDFLCNNEEEAIFLRDSCIFKVIPMMNPDGVIHGNYRTGLAGVDTNRRWKTTKKSLYPTVYAAKNLIKNFANARQLEVICDLHGHSRKKSSFFYGCTDEKDPTKSRLLPFILSKLTDMFTMQDCRFNIHKSKESTARVALWREYQIPNIFTLEASFFGYDSKDGKTVPYTIKDFMNIGRCLCMSIYVYMTHVKGLNKICELPFQLGAGQQSEGKFIEDQEASGQKGQKVVLNAKNLLAELKNDKALLKYGDLSDDSGSDSNPSDDELPKEHLAKILPKMMRAKVVKKIAEENKSKATKKMEIFLSKSKVGKIQPKFNEEVSDSNKKAVEVQASTQLRATFKVRSKTEIKHRQHQDQETQTEEFIYDLLIKIESEPTQKSNRKTIVTFNFQGKDFLVMSPRIAAVIEKPLDNKFTFNFERKEQRKSVQEQQTVQATDGPQNLNQVSFTLKDSKQQSQKFFSDGKSTPIGTSSYQSPQMETANPQLAQTKNINFEKTSEMAFRGLKFDPETILYDQKAFTGQEPANNTPDNKRITSIKHKLPLELRNSETNAWLRTQKPTDPRFSSRNAEINYAFKSPKDQIPLTNKAPVGHGSQPQLRSDRRINFFLNNIGGQEALISENRPFTASLLPSISDEVYQLATKDANHTQKLMFSKAPTIKLKMMNEEFPEHLSSKTRQKGFRQPKILTQSPSVRAISSNNKYESHNNSRSQYNSRPQNVKQVYLPMTTYSKQIEKFLEALSHMSEIASYPEASHSRKF